MKEPEAILEIPCGDIRIGERHRRDLGNLEELAASIAEEGLLQPIGITEENLLVFGERRLLAVRDILKRPTIAARVVRVSSIVAGEYAENEIRKNFTPSERVAIGKALEAEIGSRQGQRTDRQPQDNCPEVPAGTRPDKQLPQNFAEVAPGVETRAVAAKGAGFGNRTTYGQAKKVLEQAIEEVVAQMDAGELSVSAAALISEQPPEKQREIAQLPEKEKKAALRQLRRQDLPTPAEARRQALASGLAVLDRNFNYQLPTPESQRPVVERNYAAMAVVDAARGIAGCRYPASEIAQAIRSLDTPDVDFAGQCRKAAVFLEEINREWKHYESQ